MRAHRFDCRSLTCQSGLPPFSLPFAIRFLSCRAMTGCAVRLTVSRKAEYPALTYETGENDEPFPLPRRHPRRRCVLPAVRYRAGRHPRLWTSTHEKYVSLPEYALAPIRYRTGTHAPATRPRPAGTATGTVATPAKPRISRFQPFQKLYGRQSQTLARRSFRRHPPLAKGLFSLSAPDAGSGFLPLLFAECLVVIQRYAPAIHPKDSLSLPETGRPVPHDRLFRTKTAGWRVPPGCIMCFFRRSVRA